MKSFARFGLTLLVASYFFAQHGFAQHGFAQRGGFPAAGGGSGTRAAFRGGPFRSPAAGRRIHPAGSPFGGFYSYPFGDDFEYAPPYAYPAPPTTIVVEPIQPAAVQQAPERIGNAVIHTYSVGSTAIPAGEQPTFVIALGDGSRVDAAAVWVQDGNVHYIDSEDRGRQIPLSLVDRNLTRKLNQDRNLTLRFPAP